MTWEETPCVFDCVDPLHDDFLADVATWQGGETGAVTITVDMAESFKQRVKAAFAGQPQPE